MLFLLPALSSPPAIAPCEARVQASAQAVRSLQAQLFSIRESDKDDFTENPPLAMTQVPEFRRALAAVTEALLECSPPTATASDIRTALANLLHANLPDAATHDKIGQTNHVFGDALHVTAKDIATNPDQVAIDIDFSAQCGEDDVLVVFERNEKKWQQKLDWHSAKYTKPSDAFGDIFLYDSGFRQFLTRPIRRTITPEALAMRLTAELDTEPTFNAAIDAAQQGPVIIEREHEEVAVILSARQYRLWRQEAIEEFNRFCDEMSDRAEARGMTEEKLKELLEDD